MSTFQSQDLIATLALVVTLAGRFMLLLVNSSNQLTLVRPYLNPQRTARYRAYSCTYYYVPLLCVFDVIMSASAGMCVRTTYATQK